VTLANGQMTMTTEYGTVTGDGVYKISDTSSSDTFVGSSSDESFRFQYGGNDTVTGGGGSDRFRLEYRETTWATGDQPSLPYSVHITDYASDDVIRFEEMGFESAVLKKQIEASYDSASDTTTISVVTDKVDRGQVEAVVEGEWLIGQVGLDSFSDASREAYAEVRLVSADPNQMLNDIVQTINEPGRFFDVYTHVHLDHIPEVYLTSGISLVASGTSNTITLNGTTYSLPDFAAGNDYTSYYTSASNDVIEVAGAAGFHWSPGDDQYTGDPAALFALFNAGSYGLQFDASTSSATTGLTIDNSSGVLTVVSSFGTTTGYNFNDIFDSPFSDTIIGSDSADFFKTQFGGYDVVTGGSGVDQFEVRYWTDRAGIRDGDSHWWKELQGIEITDYESGEIIELQSMDFSSTNYANEITSFYDQVNDLTVIGVTNDRGNVAQDFVFVQGQFELNADSLVYVAEGNGVTPGD